MPAHYSSRICRTAAQGRDPVEILDCRDSPDQASALRRLRGLARLFPGQLLDNDVWRWR